MPASLENSTVATGLEKFSFHCNPKERQCQNMLKLPHNCTHLIHYKVMLKILQAKLQQYVNGQLQKRQRNQRSNCQHLLDHRKSKRVPRSMSTSALLTMPKPLLTGWITTNCGKFFRRWESQTTLPALWKICMQANKQQLELDREQWTGSKLGKEYTKCVYCHLAYMQSTLC